MKTLLAVSALFLAVVAKADVPCQMTDQDYKALAVSPSKMTRDAVQALSPTSDQAQQLCQTRQFVQKVETDPTSINTTDAYWASYLSPREKTEVVHAMNLAIQRMINGAGVTVVV